jgi:hypothetical protein
VKESPAFPKCERCELRLTPLVVQVSDSRWTAAPHLPQAPNQTSRPDKSDSVQPTNDDTVGWPDELLIDFPDFPDCTLDSAAQTPCLSKNGNRTVMVAFQTHDSKTLAIRLCVP